MKKFTSLFAIALVAIGTSSAMASVLTYRLKIDGNSATSQPQLAAGSHTLVVEAQVTEDVIAGMNGGVLQSSFNLGTNNGGFTFTDLLGGFLGTPNGQWDSVNLIPPFDTHLNGTTANGGGPTVSQETSFISPTNYNDKFTLIGANVFTTVGQGNFTIGGTHPLTLTLTSNPSITRVAGFDGTQIVSQSPTTVVGYTINFTDGGGGDTPPTITDPVNPRPTGLNRNFMFQFVATDVETPSGPFVWSIDSFAGGPAPNPPSIDTTGKFTWNTTGAQGSGTDYTAVVRVAQAGDATKFDTATLVINVPEPGTIALAGLSLIGIVTSRRRLS